MEIDDNHPQLFSLICEIEVRFVDSLTIREFF